MEKGNIVKLKLSKRHELGRIRTCSDNDKFEVEWFLPDTGRIIDMTIEDGKQLIFLEKGDCI